MSNAKKAKAKLLDQLLPADKKLSLNDLRPMTDLPTDRKELFILYFELSGKIIAAIVTWHPTEELLVATHGGVMFNPNSSWLCGWYPLPFGKLLLYYQQRKAKKK